MRYARVGRSAARWFAVATAAAVGAYAAYVAFAWRRYGHVQTAPEGDDLIDAFLPAYDVRERHEVAVAAPPGVTLAAAAGMDLLASPLARGIVRSREILLGSTRRHRHSTRLLDEVRAMGWGILAEHPGREIVVGAVTRPWEADVVFRAVEPERFASFHEPGYVKIAWTLRADPDGQTSSVFRTETRALATDDDARTRFRWYWATLSPGIILIRRSLLRPLRAEAERRARREARPAVTASHGEGP